MQWITRIGVILPLLLGGCIAFACEIRAAQLQTLSVCDVFKDMKSWSGKQIKVRGKVFFSFEATGISENNCPVALETDGLKWPTDIQLRQKNGDLKNPGAEQRSFTFFMGITGLLLQIYFDAFPPMPIPYQISATFTGTLITKDSYGKPGRDPQGRAMGSGFGHFGAFPAQLEIIAVDDIVITRLQNEVQEKP